MSPMWTTNLSISISPNNFIVSRCNLLLSSYYVSCPHHHPSTTLCRAKAAAKGGAGAASNSSSSSKKTSWLGSVFEPFEQVRNKFDDLVPCLPQQSVARQFFSHDSEASINQHINVECNVSYVYHAMYAYFDRDNVGLKGLAKFFKESSDEKREHAEKFMQYQNKRGGKVKLHSILMPLSEFDHLEKGDALHSMEVALALEKLTNEKLLNVHEVATRNNDVHLAHFVKDEFLGKQVESIKKISEYVAQLRRIGRGHGVWHFDQMLLEESCIACAETVTFFEVF